MQSVKRLITLFRPDSYDLHLSINRTKRTFTGSVTIIGSAPEATKGFILHAVNLDISAAVVDGTLVSTSLKNDELSLHGEFNGGSHTLELTFSGTILDSLHGLYPCYYEHNGIKKELLMTQFESHHAREVFPCIDEPEAKATFNLTLTTEPGVTVLGNMPVEKQHEKDEKLITEFERTPKMSTYLLAFVIGELQHKEAHTKDGVLVRSFATPAQPAHTLDFSLDVAVRTIEFFNDYFGIPYPLPKSDHIAVPDFSAGAMENWGLITYREIALLVDPDNTSLAMKEYIATVIAHELSHQWFGNLVTMKWWDDLWLNESFATLMEYIAVDALYPDWNIWLTFASSETLAAQRRDCLPGIQAVRTPVHHPDEISTLFDAAIVYAKGAKLLKMLYHFIGEQAFKNGLQHYFKQHAYANTTGLDLWTALGKATGEDLGGFMQAWLDKPGYPVVSASQHGRDLTLKQHRFLTIQDSSSLVEDSLWPIPLAASQPLGIKMLHEHEYKLELASDNIVKLNMEDQSYFVTRYTTKTQRDYLRQQIEAQAFSPIERLQLLNESLLLARGHEEGITESLELLTAYEHETSEPVWDIISLLIADTRRLIEGDLPATEHLRTFVRDLVNYQFVQLGWNASVTETPEMTKLRATILGLGLWAEHEAILRGALDRFEAFKSPNEIPADIRTIIYTAGSRHGGKSAFKKLIQLHNHENSSEERTNLCVGITASRDQEVIADIITLLQRSEIIRPQDVDRWFAYLMRNISSRTQAWQWLTRSWDWIEQQFGTDKSYDSFVRYSAAALQGKDWYDSYLKFFEPLQKQPALTRVIEVGLNDILARTAWIERDALKLRQYLEANQ